MLAACERNGIDDQIGGVITNIHNEEEMNVTDGWERGALDGHTS